MNQLTSVSMTRAASVPTVAKAAITAWNAWLTASSVGKLSEGRSSVSLSSHSTDELVPQPIDDRVHRRLHELEEIDDLLSGLDEDRRLAVRDVHRGDRVRPHLGARRGERVPHLLGGAGEAALDRVAW